MIAVDPNVGDGTEECMFPEGYTLAEWLDAWLEERLQQPYRAPVQEGQ